MTGEEKSVSVDALLKAIGEIDPNCNPIQRRTLAWGLLARFHITPPRGRG